MDPNNLPGHVAGLPNILNVRDLGGLPSADGRRVRKGMLYRSGALVDLGPQQRARIESLGLRFILDLRAVGEAEGREDFVPAGAAYERVCGMYFADGEEVDFSPAGIMRMAEEISGKGEHFMRELYVSMMFDNPALRTLMGAFSRRREPLLFHCTAGKDRTGVCAAVLLMALGVPDEEIIREFLLTNEYRAEIINMDPKDIPAELPADQRERWAQINGVSREDLQASLDAVDGRYPSREAYLAAEFGLSDDVLAQLRSWYLA